jgi:predicted RNA-binding Zn-ribbon protein involved in translation (DUF1610 family)
MKYIKTRTSEKQSKYKCPNCKSLSYTITTIRDITPIYDGPHNLPIGHEDNGTKVEVQCNKCGWDLNPTEDDMDRLFSYRKGAVFY